jgi:hypothetical protein
MSGSDDSTPDDSVRLFESGDEQTLGLWTAYDDPEDPEEATVYWPDAPDLTTSWLTVNVDHVEPLSEMR